jgi:hypothetical protein
LLFFFLLATDVQCPGYPCRYCILCCYVTLVSGTLVWLDGLDIWKGVRSHTCINMKLKARYAAAT